VVRLRVESRHHRANVDPKGVAVAYAFVAFALDVVALRAPSSVALCFT
jgi:hypothetical protein